MLVNVLDHDNGGIDHGANRNRDTPKGHDVGIDALQAHDDKGRQYADR